ncbi:MAG: 4-hydroxybenzoate octaprenyltransferase [Magnetococcales bacterium]|nr:4-hydroxybenzoate octaprenyltransferase [Magnetococcales bacterium]
MMMERLVNATPWPLVRESLRLMRVDRPIGTWLLLWPSLWGLVAAQNGTPDLRLIVIFLVGAFVMRSAGCVANDLADRRFDAEVARCKDRPLAAGRISVGAAKGLLFILLGVAFLLALMLGALAFKLCFVGAFLAVSYPFTKRFLDAPQLYMGAAFGWGVIIAWAEASGEVHLAAWLFFGATLAWAAGYDTIYAMMDRPDDLRIGVRSSAILFGERVVLGVGVLYGVMLVLLLAAGVQSGVGWGYFGALMVVQGHLSWQLYRLHQGRAEEMLGLFLSNRWTGLIVLLGLGLR